MTDRSRTPRQVFLAYNPADEPAIEAIAYRLEHEGITPWLRAWDLAAGDDLVAEYERALREVPVCAVFVGGSGPESWQLAQLKLALTRRIAEPDAFRVIPVLLPGGARGKRSQWPDVLSNTVWVEFGSSLEDERALAMLVAGILGRPPGPGPRPLVAEMAPYPGLRAFDVGEADLFFGREARVQWVIAALRGASDGTKGTRFLAMVGPSGSGKSSLARAGLLAALKRGVLPASELWPQAICRPSYHPVESLALALCEARGLGDDLRAISKVHEVLLNSERGLYLVARSALRHDPIGRLVVLVDQFEECFTLCADEAERRAMIENLVYAAREPGGQALVVISIRADFYGRCVAYPALAALVSDYHDLVDPLTSDEVREAIRRPAEGVGAELEPGLEQRLMADLGTQQGGLPLLQHALRELWERRAGRRLTHAAYEAIGGITGALEQQAQAVYDKLDVPRKEVCRQLMLDLLQPADSDLYTRRRVARPDLKQQGVSLTMVDEVVQALVDARLLTSMADDLRPEAAAVEIAHEALISHWPLLRTWLDQERSALLARRQLRLDAARWESSERKESYLYRGDELAAARAQTRSVVLGDVEQAFMEASDDAERRARRRWRIVVASLVVLGTLVAVIGTVALIRDANQRAKIESLAPLWVFQEGTNMTDSVLALAAPTGDGRWYAGTANSGVGRSRDGVTWSFFREGLPAVPTGEVRGVNRLAVDDNSQRLIAAVVTGGVYWSTDGGERWQPSLGLPPEATVRHLRLSGNLALAVTAAPASQLYTSDDGGVTWRPATGLPPDQKVYAALIVSGARTAYLGTSGGVYSSPLPTPKQPWDWQHVSGLPPSLLLAPGPESALDLATTSLDDGRFAIKRWQGGQLRPLGLVEEQPTALAPRPEGDYVLLSTNQLFFIGKDGKPVELGTFAGFGLGFDMLALPEPQGNGTRLLVGNQQGLLLFRFTLGGER